MANNTRTFLTLVIAAFAFTLGFAPRAAAKSSKPRIPSATLRSNLTGQIAFEPAGIFAGNYLGIGTGLSVGMFQDSDTILRAGIHTAKSCLDERCSNAYDGMTLSMQRFVGNSFFVEAGLARETVIQHQVEDEYSSASDRRFHFTYNVQTEGAYFGFGNQWQFDHFTIGGRWAATTVPLHTSSATVTSETLGAGPEEARELHRIEQQSRGFLATMMLGWSW